MVKEKPGKRPSQLPQEIHSEALFSNYPLNVFSVEIMTMDDLEILEKIISEDGRLLLEFKADVTKIMEYIIYTDFAAEPFDMSLSDCIQDVLAKWNRTGLLPTTCLPFR